MNPHNPTPGSPDGGTPAMPSASWTRVLGYLTLACLLCWLVAAPGLLGVLPEEVTATLVPVAQLTPLLATIPFLVLARRSNSAVDVLALRWKGSPRWTVIGIGVMALICTLQLLLGLALGWQPRPIDATAMALLFVVPLLILQAVFAIGEELGWRGWLITQTRAWGFPAMAILSSVAWTVWHLPAAALFPLTPAQQLAYLLGIASWAPFFVSLRLASGSVWPAVILHGGVNSLRVFLLQSVADSGGVNWAVEAFGWLLWIAAAVWLYRQHVSRPGL